MLGWGILFIIASVLIAIWPARIASRKGHSFLIWFIISLFFWWITLFWVTVVLKGPPLTAKERADEKAVNKALEREEG
ncbi:hypothetical protein KC946_01530 [Candidatus Saccharibacteria bacterium]|nr:hypothetical protein [Candidatus Saccharibacteria bacterium]